MEIVTSANILTKKIKYLKQQGKSIGFVPTMGYLHAGHLSLVKESKKNNDVTVASIFVNPTQFGPNEDLDKYPRDLERDKKLLEKISTDILFFPSIEEIYPPDNSTKKLTADKHLSISACGNKRPGHFDGVVTVVNRLFEIVTPDNAYFGLKDYQQYLTIKKMTQEQNHNIKIIGCPIVRETDGLALSSRNTYLNKQERQDALILSQTLSYAKEQISKNNTDLEAIKKEIVKQINKINSAKIDYVEFLNANTLQPISDYQPGNLTLLMAIYIGKTRLIDNLII